MVQAGRQGSGSVSRARGGGPSRRHPTSGVGSRRSRLEELLWWREKGLRTESSPGSTGES